MKRLIDALLLAFESRFEGIFCEDSLGHSTSTRFFLREVKYFLIVLRNIKLVHGRNVRIALIANSTMDFIACYIALILSNLDFHLISNKMKDVIIDSIISGNDINFVFTDKFKGEGWIRLPFFKGVFDIKKKEFKFLKSDRPKETYNEINRIMYESAVEREGQISLRKLSYEIIEDRVREITVYSSGINNIYINPIVFTDDTVFEALAKITKSEDLPDLYNKKVSSLVSYDYAPVWAILWPISAGGIFTPNYFDSEVLIDSSDGFEEKWKFVIENEVYEKRFIGKLLMKDWLYWLFKFFARRKLNTYFNGNVKKEAIIIINAILSPRINETISKLPIYTTYGMQEANHVVAVNDYSTYRHRMENCVGKLFEGIIGEIREDSLILGSIVLSKDIIFEKDVWYDTRDHAEFRNGLLFVYGKMKYAIHDSLFNGSNRENIERIIKSVPYFQDVLLFQDSNNDNHLLIYPNVKVIEAMKYGLLDFMNLIKPYMKLINDRFGTEFISSIKVVFNDFMRTHTGKIHKELYFIASRRDRKELGF